LYEELFEELVAEKARGVVQARLRELGGN